MSVVERESGRMLANKVWRNITIRQIHQLWSLQTFVIYGNLAIHSIHSNRTVTSDCNIRKHYKLSDF